ncbi:hypothetical protein [Clostridium gasigenes]|uniref:Uncharacterized protein n=1 Tax=Clostridium gasigenes TaxID=94869 RepID=A0A7X0R523_9CLOT|nr:hypothetical protein [Clostridium gasigenes]MBB6621802.1 hypothetical protein [Clostridium gasigenes]MBB6716174.1 hypothetical protein [Clostridium gasigenes]MBU3087362.1 hypothetical protein [Clostridium gasigenes]MBU3102891.1 hypothetical protein [Clostridium gasigenes]MBU3131502.1 hypothetical protein [Clostridium gasigenes]
MKNYLKNKNFIPRNYVENSENIKNKGNRKGVIYLIIINLFIIPVTIERVFEKEKPKEIEVAKPIEQEVSKESIIKWINEIDKDVEELTVKNNSGTMMIKSIEKLYSLEEKESMSIDNITQNEKKYYILGITRNEKGEK